MGIKNDITCSSCGEKPRLAETPYSNDHEYVIRCGCEFTTIDVTNCVNGNKLLTPISGKWSNFDQDSRA